MGRSSGGPPFAALRALEAACRLRSYSLAGEELGVTHSAISQSIHRLEDAYAVRLFLRDSAGRMTPNAAAEALAQAYRDAAAGVDRALTDVSTGDDGGVLVISILSSVAKLWLGPKLKRLSEAMPDVRVEVRVSRQLANLHDDGVDVALRIGQGGPWPGLRSVRLFEEYAFPVCSPDYQACHLDHDCTDACISTGPLIMDGNDLWPEWFEAAGLVAANSSKRMIFDDAALCVDAAIAGLGVALVRRLHSQEALANGLLVRLSNVQVNDNYAYYLVWREDSPRLGAIRRFVDWVLDECDRAGLRQAGDARSCSPAAISALNPATAAAGPSR